MKYSYLWLKELSGTKKSPKELAELLTMRAFEFEDSNTEGKETQMEFSILPNRGHDALSHVGMAREICACEGRKFKLKVSFRNFLKETFRNELKVSIKDKKLCPRYIGAVVEGMKTGPSPKWMREKLLVCGVKPINNIVDITNYVMLELGQPLHAFDIVKTTGNIIVRKAKKRGKIKLLDEKVYELNENDLVIADTEKPIALAGVMGGFNSSITSKTTSIILESANFNSTSIRKTRTAHNITTESSHRFEREIDPNLAEAGIARAIGLIKKICGKNVKITAVSDVYPKKVKPWQIKLDTNYVNSLLGENIPVSKMKSIMENLGLAVKFSGKFLKCGIPTFRIDLKSQEDLVEEIGRIYGYENIKEQAPIVKVKTPPQNAKRYFENNLRDILVGLGFSEVMNYSFYGADDIAKCNLKIDDHVEVANPLSLEQQYLRISLTPGLVRNTVLNIKHLDKFSIFEIGNVFFAKNSRDKEKTLLAGTLADKNSKNTLFHELKGRIEEFFKRIEAADIDFEKPKIIEVFFHPTRTAVIKLKNKVIGYIGELNPTILRKHGIKERPVFFELDIAEIMKAGENFEKKYNPISKFPIVERDISMFVGKNTKYNEIETKINKAGGKLVLGIELFDVFEKESEKSLAIRIKIGSDAKTLASAEIDAVMKKIISALEKNLKVKVRK